MSDKVVVIISTAGAEKARTGAMYAVNALKFGWLDEVKLVFFGPSERLLLKDAELRQYLREFQDMDENVVACKFIADREGISAKIAELEVEVRHVGEFITDLVKAGYTPMIW